MQEACWVGPSDSSAFCRAAQTGCSCLVQPQDFRAGRRLPGGASGASSFCSADRQQSSTGWLWQQPGAASGFRDLHRCSLGWCQTLFSVLQSCTGCHVVACSRLVQPWDFRVCRELVGVGHQTAQHCSEQHGLSAAAWCSHRISGLAGGALWGGARHSPGCWGVAQAVMVQPPAAW